MTDSEDIFLNGFIEKREILQTIFKKCSCKYFAQFGRILEIS